MKKKKTVAAATLSLALITSFGVSKIADAQDVHKANPKQAKNVIMFVGDGMGASHREAIRLAAEGINGELAMNKMTHTGNVHTHSTSVVTDSAAAGTAMATGVKTYNGAIGMDENQKPVTSVLELASKAGKSTGLVTTSQITDATPASFGAHVKDRDEQSEIAKQYLENSKVDVLLGGGEDYWYPAGTPGDFEDHPAKDKEEASKGTRGNLVDRAEKLGYDHVTNQKDLEGSKSHRILGLFANEEMFEHRHEGEGDQYDPVVPLPDMTKKAISTLSQNQKGFFLMVEEEGVDEMSHENNGKLMMKAGQQLDNSVQVAKDYAKKHPDTLVLVAADHESGGLAIEEVNPEDESGEGASKEDGPFTAKNSDEKFTLDWTTNEHGGESVPLTAQGPGSEKLAGTYENTKIFKALKEAMGLK